MQLTSGPLEAFLSMLGLDARAKETPKVLTVSADVRGEAVLGLTYGVVERLMDAYGSALQCGVFLDELQELTIASSITPDTFDAEKANLEGGSGYRLSLRLDKGMLQEAVLGGECARHTVYYVFAASVESLLSDGLRQWEEAVEGEAAEPRRLLIGDTDLRRTGPVFQLIGGSHLRDELAPLPPLPESTTACIERVRTARRDQISWDHEWVRALTPVQLQLNEDPGPSRVEQMLASAYVRLCLLHTCTRGRRRPDDAGGWQAQMEYQGANLSVRVPVREGEPLGTPITKTTVIAFAELVDWCYRLRDEGTTLDWAADRLQFTQVRVAQLLKPEAEAARLATLVRQIPAVVEALDDQWRAFIEDRFTLYLDQERQLEVVVNDVVGKYGEKTMALTKGLSDALLAAVAVLIGSAIAAAFKAPFNVELFRIGVLTYAGYVLIFPGLYGMSSHFGQFIETRNAFDHERRRFNALIGTDKTNAIIGARVSKSQRRYRRWFWLSVVGYAFAIAGTALAAVKVPSIVA